MPPVSLNLCFNFGMATVRIVKIVTLDIQRRHARSCSQYKKPYADCLSASKKKCPYRIFGIWLDEYGNRQRIRKTLRTNDQEEASKQVKDYRANMGFKYRGLRAHISEITSGRC